MPRDASRARYSKALHALEELRHCKHTQMENQSDFLVSLIRATKNYVGHDPLLPWLQGIKKIKETLPPDVANQKLPRFLEKCTQTFQNDRRYRNDLRYLQLWIQLLEFVPNRGEVLSVLERNKIGLNHALYYQAQALHYEKLKKFLDAEAMYKLGIQRLAEPAESFQQSYDSFLQRMAHRNRRKLKSRKAKAMLPSEDIQSKANESDLFASYAELGIKGGENELESFSKDGTVFTYSDKSTADDQTCDECVLRNESLFSGANLLSMENGQPNRGKVNSEGESNVRLLGTVVDSAPSLVSDTRYQDSVSMEESLDCGCIEELHDTSHHVLVGPSVNTKEVNAGVNHIEKLIRKNPSQGINGTKPAVEKFQILPDENLEEPALNQQLSIEGNDSSVPADQKEGGLASAEKNDSHIHADNRSGELVPVKGFEILADDRFTSSRDHTSKDEIPASSLVKDFKELSGIEEKEQNNDYGVLEEMKRHKQFSEGSDSITSLPSKFCTEETIIIRKFVDSTIVGDTQEVEDAYHHGLIEPTINTKEAMADINDMFGKLLNFEKSKLANQAPRMQTSKQPVNIFQVLVDEDLKEPGSAQKRFLSKISEGETPIVPMEKDLQVFVDENLIYNSFDDANSSKNLASFQGLRVLSDTSFKGSQNTIFVQRNTGKDQRFSSVPGEFYQDGIAIMGKNGNNSKGKNGHGQFANIGEKNMPSKSCSEDIIVIHKFVDSAIVGDSKESNHHGLVDPTVNTKEAMNEINNMFLKPLQFDKQKTKKQPPRADTFKKPVENFLIFADEDLQEQGVKQQCHVSSIEKTHDSFLSCVKNLEVFVDENILSDSIKELTGTFNSSEDLTHVQDLQTSIDESSERIQEKTLNKYCTFENRAPSFPTLNVNEDRQFLPTVNLSSDSCNEDTIVIRKIVDSTIVDTEIEDSCHHGLVEPTINTKEAMADINDMFRQSLPFDNTKKSCRPPKAGTIKQLLTGPCILADEDMEKEGLKQRCPLPNNSEAHDSSLPLVKSFQIFVDENVQSEYSNKHTKRYCLSGDNVSVPVITNHESSSDIQQKPSIPSKNSKDEGICMPRFFQVFIDEQFQE